MGAIWEKNIGYKLCRIYADHCTRTCFSSLETKGLENIPQDALVLLASNHCCALMDPMVILQSRKGFTAFGARADIFRKPAIAKILRWLRIVPIARERDGLQAVAGNIGIFDEIVECLEHGVPFCLFVEGTHRPKHSLLPLKKGIFRIAQIAAGKQERPVYIVPVGIEYGSYFELMHPATITYGEPIRITTGSDGIEVMKTLRERMSALITYFPDDADYESNWAEYSAKHRKKRSPLAWPAALLLFPFFVVSGLLCLPVLIATVLYCRTLEDNSWYNTARFACKFFVLPLTVLLAAVLGFIFLPWPAALTLVLAVCVSHSLFYTILKFYKTILGK